jgi:hypothetical protein
MKLVMIYSIRFEERTVEDVLVGFIHAEPQDEAEAGAVETRLVKNLKWAARKNGTNRILLHSFAHLAEGKATPEFTKDLLSNTEARLAGAGYEVSQTPFGFFLDLHLEAPGRSLALTKQKPSRPRARSTQRGGAGLSDWASE